MEFDSVTVPRHLLPRQWAGHINPQQLMADSIMWAGAAGIPITYMTEDGVTTCIALAFSVPVSDDDCGLLVFPLDLGQVGALTMELSSALAAVYGKTLGDVIEEAKRKIREGEL